MQNNNLNNTLLSDFLPHTWIHLLVLPSVSTAWLLGTLSAILGKAGNTENRRKFFSGLRASSEFPRRTCFASRSEPWCTSKPPARLQFPFISQLSDECLPAVHAFCVFATNPELWPLKQQIQLCKLSMFFKFYLRPKAWNFNEYVPRISLPQTHRTLPSLGLKCLSKAALWSLVQ